MRDFVCKVVDLYSFARNFEGLRSCTWIDDVGDSWDDENNQTNLDIRRFWYIRPILAVQRVLAFLSLLYSSSRESLYVTWKSLTNQYQKQWRIFCR
jgi:hypothetical protein